MGMEIELSPSGLSTKTPLVGINGAVPVALVDPSTGTPIATTGGGVPIRQVASDVAFPAAWKLPASVAAATTRLTRHSVATVVFETADCSGFLPFDSLMLLDTSADAITATLQARPGSKVMLTISGLTGSTASLVGVYANGVVSAALGVSAVATPGTYVTALGNGSYLLDLGA